MPRKKSNAPKDLQHAYRDLLREHTAALMAECAETGESARAQDPPEVALDPRQFKAVQRQAIAMLATARPTEVARRLEIGRRTLHEWMRDEGFNRALAEEIARREHDIRSASKAAFHAALDTCRELLDEKSSATRLQAAGLLLKHCAPRVASPADFGRLVDEVRGIASGLEHGRGARRRFDPAGLAS